jgi:hypothetical protein
MRRASPERGENSGPARNFIRSLTPNPELENPGSPGAMPADSQARQKSLNYRTQSLQRGRLLSRAISRHLNGSGQSIRRLAVFELLLSVSAA